MKIVVPVKRVVDYNVNVRPNDEGTNVEIANVKMSINPFCEIGVEEAVRLKDKGIADEVIVVSVGETKAQEQLRAAMAMGADRAILLETDENLEPLAVAKCLKVIVEREAPGLVILGKQSIDGDNNQTGQMLAALCSMAQGTFASDIVVEEDKVKVTREIDGGSQTLALKLPAVITADLRLNEPRFASLPNIMKAKKKPVEIISVRELGIDTAHRVTLLEVAPPQERAPGVKVGSVDELIDKLKNEAKVI